MMVVEPVHGHVRVSASDLDALEPTIAWQRTAVQQSVPIAEGRGELTGPGTSVDVTLLGGWLDHNFLPSNLKGSRTIQVTESTWPA